jgi:uncharacterized protein YgiM (DUF1202 family)
MSTVNWWILAALVCLPASRTAAADQAATVKQDRVNVRGQATLHSEVITQLRKAETVTVLEDITVEKPKPGEPAQWSKILLPTNTPVWVHASFIEPNTKAVQPTQLNVRAGPGENYSVLGRLKRGDTVKEIRRVDNWLEIEPPPGTYAFVASDLLEKPTTVAAAPGPEPAKAKETKAAKAEPAQTTPAAVPATTVPVPPEPTPAPAKAPETTPAATPAAGPPAAGTPATVTPAPAAAEPAPPATASSPSDQPPPKRVVRREGFVRPTVSVQAPTYYAIESADTGRLMNYLYTDSDTLHLKHLKGFKIVVTGEEFIDNRWPKTPIIKIDTLEVAP